MMCHFKPKNIIEIGSGFSSAAMLDTHERVPDIHTQFTFIEPFESERIHSLLRDNDLKTASIIESPVQEIDLSIFENLKENDILFINSSHVVKHNSDVCYILFEILPILQKGIAWNEAYFLRSFLQFNNTFKIIFLNAYLGHCHTEDVEKCMPATMK